MPKKITYPTYVKLFHGGTQKLRAFAKKHSISIGGYDAKSPRAILQDLLKQRPQDLKTQQAASVG